MKLNRFLVEDFPFEARTLRMDERRASEQDQGDYRHDFVHCRSLPGVTLAL